MKSYLLASLITVPFLTGCVIAVSDGDGEVEIQSGKHKKRWEIRHEDNRAAIATLAPGSSYDMVLHELGTPEFSENLQLDGISYQVLFYATQSLYSDSKTTRDECTPLVFKNGKLSGWGELAYMKLQ